MNIQRALLLINLAFITLGAYFAAGLFYQICEAMIQPEPQIAKTQSMVASNNRRFQKPFNFYRPVLQRDLFKAHSKSTASTGNMLPIDREAPATSLELKLWGTVTGNTDKSYAVIEDVKKRQQNLYRVGDPIQNATVKAIFKEEVILSRNGRNEKLKIEDIKTGRPKHRRSYNRTSYRGVPSSGTVRKQRITLRRGMINEAIQDVSTLMTQIKINPHRGSDGNPDGLSVSNIKPNSIFRRMGLRNGDILKSVDGQSIQSVDDALKLYDNLKNANNVSVVIQRRGRERNLEYNIR